MKLLDKLKNSLYYNDKYKTNSEAVIIACYFNPQRNPYRLTAFREFYESIKHLNHLIIECTIDGSAPEIFDIVPPDKRKTVSTQNYLWHKEALLNKAVTLLDPKYKYVFWLDADVLFTNKNWLVEACEELKHKNIVQPFEYCIHLNQDSRDPQMNLQMEKMYVSDPKRRNPRIWRSFSANYVTSTLSNNVNYDVHGHVGFAWGAKREILDAVPLYDKALVGGADHIIAHAAAGHFNHSCIAKAFKDNIDEIESWSRKFHYVVNGSIGYVQGELLHIWHGDVAKRQYLKRVQEFTEESKKITQKDKNGLYVTNDDSYVRNYFNHREVKQQDDGFIESMAIGYITDSTVMGTVLGGNPLGAAIGDMLNNSEEHNHSHDHSHHDHNNDTIQSDNFS